MGAKPPRRIGCSVRMTARFVTKYKTGLLLCAGALFVFALTTTPSSAGFAQNGYDNAQLMNRINQLENQVQTLSRSVYRGATPPAPAANSYSNTVESAPLGAPALGAYQDRITALEDKQRDQTGEIERLNHEIIQLKDRLERMQADVDMRFGQQGGATSGGAPSYQPPARTPLGSSDAHNAQPYTLGSMTNDGASSPERLYEDAFSDIREAKYDSAQKKFIDFMGKYPNHQLAANAQYWLAETHYVRGDYRQSAKLFAQGYRDYPQGPKAADCLLKLGLSLSKQGQKEDACLALAQLQKDFPSASNPANRRGVQEMQTLGCK